MLNQRGYIVTYFPAAMSSTGNQDGTQPSDTSDSETKSDKLVVRSDHLDKPLDIHQAEEFMRRAMIEGLKSDDKAALLLLISKEGALIYPLLGQANLIKLAKILPQTPIEVQVALSALV